MNENQMKRQHAIDALEVALIGLRANVEAAMPCLESLKRSRKSDMKEEAAK